MGVLCGAREGRGCWLLAMVRSAPRPCCFVQWYFSRAGFSTLQRGGYTALVQTQLEAGGGAWGHLVWQGHYLGARQGKSVVAGTHPRIPGNPDTATADQRRDGRWEIAEEEGLESRKSFSLISGRAAPGPRRSQGRRLSTPARRRKY